MRSINKIKSNSGSSMILALALLLICVMVSSVVVTTAASGTSRNYYRTEQQQNYLAVSDATEFIVSSFNVTTDKFVGSEVSGAKACRAHCEETTTTLNDDPTTAESGDSITVHTVSENCWPAETSACYLVDGLCETSVKTKVIETASFSGAFATLMETAATEVYTNNTSYTENFECSITDEFNAEEGRIPKVKCSFRMDTGYNVIIYVTSEDEDNEYTVLIEIPSEVSYDETAMQSITCQHKVYRGYVDAYNNSAYEVLPDFQFQTDVEIQKVIVTWGVPEVSKEVGTP